MKINTVHSSQEEYGFLKTFAKVTSTRVAFREKNLMDFLP